MTGVRWVVMLPAVSRANNSHAVTAVAVAATASSSTNIVVQRVNSCLFQSLNSLHSERTREQASKLRIYLVLQTFRVVQNVGHPVRSNVVREESARRGVVHKVWWGWFVAATADAARLPRTQVSRRNAGGVRRVVGAPKLLDVPAREQALPTYVVRRQERARLPHLEREVAALFHVFGLLGDLVLVDEATVGGGAAAARAACVPRGAPTLIRAVAVVDELGAPVVFVVVLAREIPSVCPQLVPEVLLPRGVFANCRGRSCIGGGGGGGHGRRFIRRGHNGLPPNARLVLVDPAFAVKYNALVEGPQRCARLCCLKISAARRDGDP